MGGRGGGGKQWGWPCPRGMLESSVVAVPKYFNFARDIVAAWARKTPEAPALWWVDAEGGNQCQWTFRQLFQLGEQAANLFQSKGVRRGDRVVIILPRIPQWWIAMLGTGI